MITISLKGRYPDHELYARDVWKVLFRIFREGGGNVDNLDNMLIDYDYLKRDMLEFITKGLVIYWSFMSSGDTWYTREHWMRDPDFYKIVYDNNTHSFIITKVELDKNGQVIQENRKN